MLSYIDYSRIFTSDLEKKQKKGEINYIFHTIVVSQKDLKKASERKQNDH